MSIRIAFTVFCLTFLTGAGCSNLTESEAGTWSHISGVTPLDEVPTARLQHVTRGINTSHWFSQTELTTQRFTTYVQESDIRMIREMGFRHVRLPLDPEVLLVRTDPKVLHQQRIGYVDEAIEMILDEGLAVVVDLHPQSHFKELLETDSDFVETVATFWNALAHHLSAYDADRVFLEVMNEPEFESADHWQTVQSRLVEAMRAAAPQHTIIATGPKWSSSDQLARIVPLEDPNVLYNFHVYDPHNFTHQGATWGWEPWVHFHDLPYPSSPAAVEPILPEIDESAREYVRAYGDEAWNRDRLEERILLAVDWARTHDVRLTANEFGVYRKEAPAEARLNWLRDAVSLFEEYGIGWAMWDYAGGFSVVNGSGPSRTPDAKTVAALGLSG